ncbi:MAG TPA: TonB-dependent receptor [Gemmatimonadales bacterium]|nr:TonB-dependent receptor [Gemmatimonadales bacterium]
MVLAASSPTAGQGTPASGEIRGRVVDAASKTPIGMATVFVTDSGAAAAAAKTSTDVDGGFRVEGLRPGRYRVRVVAIGFTPRQLAPIEIGSSSPSIDAGTVTLTAAPLQLQPKVVTGQQQDVQLAPDRNTYVVRDMPTTRGGTALDVLRNVPAVDVDIDNVVSLRGNSGVVVQINGRPSPLKPAQLGNFLAQLPADMVDKVEVIPNPSARDNPEGVAGIINIMLKQNADEGTSGGLTLGGGTTGHGDIGGNLGYQRGPLSLYGSYGFLRDNRPRRDTIYRENRYVAPRTYLEEEGTRAQVPLAHTLTGSAGYELGDHDELSADMAYSTRTEAESYGLLYRDLDSARRVTGLSDRFTRGTNHEFNLETTVGYKHAFAHKGHKLSSELRVFRAREGGPTRIVARTLALDGTPSDTSALESQTGWEHPDENSLKVDYVRPLSSLLRLETGYRGSLQQFHTTLGTQVFDTARGTYVPDSSRISDFTYDQRVHAAYGMLVAQRGKFLLQGGVRAERATTRFRLTTSNATYDNPYNSVFPSALIAYNIDASHQVKLSYSTRIRRPDDTDLLDPTPHYLDPLNISRGNPYLKPEYIRALELGLQRTTGGGRMTIQVTPFYRHTLDAVRTLRTLDSAGVMTRTFANVATSDAYGTDATVALSGGRLRGFVSASGFRQVSNAANLGPGLSAKTFGWTARTNASFRVSSTLDLQTLLSYQAPMTVEQGRVASRMRLTVAARRKLMNDQMSVTLRVIDPFNTSRESSTTIDPRFYQVSDRRRAIRGLVLSVNWRFGKPQEEHGRDPNDLGGEVGGPP